MTKTRKAQIAEGFNPITEKFVYSVWLEGEHHPFAIPEGPRKGETHTTSYFMAMSLIRHYGFQYDGFQPKPMPYHCIEGGPLHWNKARSNILVTVEPHVIIEQGECCDCGALIHRVAIIDQEEHPYGTGNVKQNDLYDLAISFMGEWVTMKQ